MYWFPFIFILPFFNIYFWLCWVFVAEHRLSLEVASGGYSLVMGWRLPTVVLSLVVEPRLWGAQASRVVMHGFNGSVACGIFPDQGLNPCLLQLGGGYLYY